MGCVLHFRQRRLWADSGTTTVCKWLLFGECVSVFTVFVQLVFNFIHVQIYVSYLHLSNVRCFFYKYILLILFEDKICVWITWHETFVLFHFTYRIIDGSKELHNIVAYSQMTATVFLGVVFTNSQIKSRLVFASKLFSFTFLTFQFMRNFLQINYYQWFFKINLKGI